MPVMKPADLCGWISASRRELKRARRSAQQTASASAAVQPNFGAYCSDQRRRIIAGATPNAITSESESSSAPNLLCARRSRAMRPSIPSSTPAKMIAASAFSHSSPIAKRTPVRPKQSASAVIALGAKARRLMPAMRRPAASVMTGSSPAILLPDAFDRLGGTDPRDHRLARQRALAEQHLRRGARGKIDVDAAAETDEADALAGGQLVAHRHERHDTPRHEARNLGEADAHAVGALDDEMLALILLARLVEVGVDEFARDIDELAQRARNGGAVDVDVEDAHEDRHAQHRRGAEPVGARDFGRRRDFGD